MTFSFGSVTLFRGCSDPPFEVVPFGIHRKGEKKLSSVFCRIWLCTFLCFGVGSLALDLSIETTSKIVLVCWGMPKVQKHGPRIDCDVVLFFFFGAPRKWRNLKNKLLHHPSRTCVGSGNLPYLPCLPCMKSSNKIALYILILNSVQKSPTMPSCNKNPPHRHPPPIFPQSLLLSQGRVHCLLSWPWL